MGSRKQPEMISDLRIDLGDTDSDSYQFQNDDLKRSIQRAVSDFSRFLPREMTYEQTLIFTISDEAWQAPSDLDNWVTLANKPIKWGTEVVKGSGGEACTRDTDYYMDYANGKIKAISGGEISTSENCTISYTVNQLRIDLSSLTDLIRVERVEYPVGNIPLNAVQTDLWGGMLTVVGSGEDDGQVELTENNHIAIYYSAHHTVPTDSAAGSYPTFLEDTLLLAAGAYALFELSVKTGHLAKAKVDAAVTAMTAIDTALNKVGTYLESNSNEDAKSWYTKITTDIADLRTAFGTAVDAIKAAVDGVLNASTGDLKKADDAKELYMGSTNNYVDGGSAPDAKKYLDDGDAFLNDMSIGGEGQEVPLAHTEYAKAVKEAVVSPYERNRQFLQDNAAFRTNAAALLDREASQRLDNLKTYIDQGNAWRDMGLSFVQEAIQRIEHVKLLFTSVDKLVVLAEKYKSDGSERRDEAWAIWRDRRQYIGDFATSSVRQMARLD